MPLQVIYITAAMMFIAILPLPELYDTLLKMVVFGTFAWGAYRNLTLGNFKSFLPWIYLLFALAFNPISPITLPKELWIGLDLVGGILLLATKKHIAE
jgi:hypothetical protein